MKTINHRTYILIPKSPQLPEEPKSIDLPVITKTKPSNTDELTISRFEPGAFGSRMLLENTPGVWGRILGRRGAHPSPQALGRAEQLLRELPEIGWTVLEGNVHHYPLDLHIYYFRMSHYIRLVVVDSDGLKHPCLRIEASGAEFGKIVQDDVVCLAYSCLFDQKFINHIESFSSGYKDCLKSFRGGLK